MAEPASRVVHVHTVSEFEAQLAGAGDKLVVVNFSAPRCGSCRRIAPVVDALSVEFKDVVFVMMNPDGPPDLWAKFGLTLIPTFQAFKCGSRVMDSVVEPSPDALRALVIKHNK